MTSHTLYLPASVRTQLENWVEAGYPLETCGLLIGKQNEGQVRVRRAFAARNLNTERAHDRYELAPDDLLAADEAAQAEGLEIVGIWHSHPEHPARPSETDRVQAWQGWSYVILSVYQGRVAELRSWRLMGEAFAEESIAAWQT
jgi:proteasome lid subunit RPN8/RPN11